MPEILPTMTIREAAALWSDPQRAHLGKWEREFNQPLKDLHVGHVVTYQTERITEVDADTVNIEVDALRALLREAGTGEEIEHHYRPLKEYVKLTADELNALPRRVRIYIRELEESLAGLHSEHLRTKDLLRKANWAKWSRSR